MKDSLVNVLEDFEKLAYKILMWVILVPKTVIKIVLDPGFVPEYVRGELGSEKGRQFDEYISPMLLYLGVTLLPAIAIIIIPAFGMKMETPQTATDLVYNAFFLRGDEYISAFSQPETFFIPVTGEGESLTIPEEQTPIDFYQIELRTSVTTKGDTRNNVDAFYWVVSGCGKKNSEGACSYDTFYYGELHDQSRGFKAFLPDENGTPTEFYSEPSQYTIIEGDESRNRVIDSVSLTFPTEEILVTVNFVNYNPDSPERPLEFYESRWVVTPSLFLPPGVSFNEYDLTASSGLDAGLDVPGFGFLETRNADESEEERVNLAKRLESSETIILGLLLLLPPLLLAGAVGIFTGPDRSFGEESLKEHFYAQCYYFVPVGMAFWATYYSVNYHANDILFPQRILLVPLALALIWFVVVEIYSMADVLNSRSKVQAFFLLLGCILAMGLVVYASGEFSKDYDLIRISSIWAYPTVGLLLLLGVIYNQTKKFRKRTKKAQGG